MEPDNQAELSDIKNAIKRLRCELDSLTERVDRLDQQPATGTGQPTQAPAPKLPPLAPTPAESTLIPAKPAQHKPVRSEPPLITGLAAAKAHSRAQITAPSEPVQPPPPVDPENSKVPAPRGSLEMRLGTYWMVRVGIVMLLTALVFFGNYAYRHIVSEMVPLAKVALMYLGSGVLIGLGLWLQRRSDLLRNYGHVLLAGGLAAVYFTTYAAHHLENLRVIKSPLIDGLLLLGWAGGVVWIADRKRSELLALFAIGLAFYTAVMTRVGSFTLFSNLVLTAAAVFFLIRNRWAAVSLAGLVASYIGYAFWRFQPQLQGIAEGPPDAVWTGMIFLAAYWCIFTWAIVWSRSETMHSAIRLSLLTGNNLMFFALMTLTLWQAKADWFWQFSIVYGTVLLTLAVVVRRGASGCALSFNAYLAHGLIFFTIGLMARFSGVQLGLLLAAESLVTLMTGRWVNSRVLRVGSLAAATLGSVIATYGQLMNESASVWLGAGTGLFLVANSVWLTWREPTPNIWHRFSTAWYVAWACLPWVVVTWQHADPSARPLVYAIEGLVLTASVHLLRVRELALAGQPFLLLGQLLWITRFSASTGGPPWWQALLLVAMALGMSHWWKHQAGLVMKWGVPQMVAGVQGLAVVGVLTVWLEPLAGAGFWVALSALLAVGMTVYGLGTRLWPVAVSGQLLFAFSTWAFLSQLGNGGGGMWSLVPILTILGVSTLALRTRWLPTGETTTQAVTSVAQLYRWLALVLTVLWVCEYIPARERCWVFVLLGAPLWVLAGWKESKEALWAWGVLTGAGLLHFWLPAHGAPTVTFLNLMAIVLLVGEQRWGRYLIERIQLGERGHIAFMAILSLTLWLWVSRWVLQQSSGFYLTVSWALLALVLFLGGLGFRERIYRWLGLGVLACALGRVVLVDVWKLETVARMLSFFALGVVLLVLGFIYNRYQDKLRQWL